MRVAVILANGFEEIEAITSIDVLRRANINVDVVGLDELEISGAHGLCVMADRLLDDISASEYDMIVLPGGLPGAEHLANSEKLGKILREANLAGKKLAAICAAPMALEKAGVLGDRFTCYPGFEANVRSDLRGYEDKSVLIDKNIITAKGPAFSMEFALCLVRVLSGDSVYNDVKNGLLY